MRFVDSVNLTVTAGNGGNGCMSFKREKFLPFGGPDGGNGGNGGSIIFVATPNLQTLNDFESRRHHKGNNGGSGEGNGRNGRCAEDVLLSVPCGTIIYDSETGEGLADLVEPGDKFVAARGGRGGRGNRVFASSANKVPRFSERGRPGETLRIRLELKLIADIGLVGLPNAGKSSVLAALSSAQPKIAAYPFTTLSPNLGVLFFDDEAVVLADLPGLIEGASDNRGLGLSFLRHIDRTRLLIHVLDLSDGDASDVIENWEIVQREMQAYDPALTERPVIILGNKIDLLEPQSSVLEEVGAFFIQKGIPFYTISAYTGENIDELAQEIIRFAKDHPRPKSEVRLYAVQEVEIPKSQRRHKLKVQVITQNDGTFRVLHSQLEDAAIRFDFSQEENIARFRRMLIKYRVEELLAAAGALSGDSIFIGKTEFDFLPDNFAFTEADNDFSDDEENE